MFSRLYRNKNTSVIAIILLLLLSNLWTLWLTLPRHPKPEEYFASLIFDIPSLPDDAKKIDMVLLPPGSFLMGSSENTLGRKEDEGPQHHVILSKPFYIGKYEVTQAQWLAVMGGTNPAEGPLTVEHGSYGVGNDYPVYFVTWIEIQNFIKKLNKLKQGGFRLPTEAEWEYACRAGTIFRFSHGDFLDVPYDSFSPDHDRYMIWQKNSGNPDKYTQFPVGSKLPNPWGLFDMHGNVAEWCADEYSSYNAGNQINPYVESINTVNVSEKVFRGGCFLYAAEDCTSAVRNKCQTGQLGWGCGLGFRLARDWD